VDAAVLIPVIRVLQDPPGAHSLEPLRPQRPWGLNIPLGRPGRRTRNAPARRHRRSSLRLLGRRHDGRGLGRRGLLERSQGFLAVVYLLVAREVSSAGEAFLAGGAAIRPVPQVGLQVPLKGEGARETLFAEPAFQHRLATRLLLGQTGAGQAPSVQLLLGLAQPGPPSVGPVAHAVGTSAEIPPRPDPQLRVDVPPDLGPKGPVFDVDALVKVQVAFVREADLAHRAFVGPLFGVAPLVDDEVDLQTEALPALGAGVRPLAHVATSTVAHQQAAALRPARLLLALGLDLLPFGAFPDL